MSLAFSPKEANKLSAHVGLKKKKQLCLVLTRWDLWAFVAKDLPNAVHLVKFSRMTLHKNSGSTHFIRQMVSILYFVSLKERRTSLYINLFENKLCKRPAGH